MDDIFEAKPRWPGAPKICLYENLPAFETMKDLGDYKSNNGPSLSIIELWQCQKCGCFHYFEEPPSPTSAKRSYEKPVPQYVRDHWKNSSGNGPYFQGFKSGQ